MKVTRKSRVNFEKASKELRTTLKKDVDSIESQVRCYIILPKEDMHTGHAIEVCQINHSSSAFFEEFVYVFFGFYRMTLSCSAYTQSSNKPLLNM